MPMNSTLGRFTHYWYGKLLSKMEKLTSSLLRKSVEGHVHYSLTILMKDLAWGGEGVELESALSSSSSSPSSEGVCVSQDADKNSKGIQGIGKSE